MLNLTMTRLRTAAWDLTVTQGSNPPVVVDLTGKVLWFFAKFSISDPDSKAAVRKNSTTVGGITVTDAVNGLATLTLDPADTDRIPLKASTQLMCDLVLIDGINKYELDTGTLTIVGNIDVPR